MGDDPLINFAGLQVDPFPVRKARPSLEATPLRDIIKVGQVSGDHAILTSVLNSPRGLLIC